MIQTHYLSTSEGFIFEVDIARSNEPIPIVVNSNYTYNYSITEIGGSYSTTGRTAGTNIPATGGFGKRKFKITGLFPGLKIQGTAFNKITDIVQWGTNPWQEMVSMFETNNNLTNITATDVPNLLQMASMERILYTSNSIVNFINIENWDVSFVKNMNNAFRAITNIPSIQNWKPTSLEDASVLFLNLTDNSYNRNILVQIYNNWVNYLPTYTSGQHRLRFPNIKYLPEAAVARQQIIDKGWTLIDGGPV